MMQETNVRETKKDDPIVVTEAGRHLVIEWR
jgi:hypothetical protein